MFDVWIVLMHVVIFLLLFLYIFIFVECFEMQLLKPIKKKSLLLKLNIKNKANLCKYSKF